MIKVKELKNNIFNTSFLSLIPKTCCYCGSDLVTLDSFSHLYCENPKCVGRIGSRLYNLFQKIGILDFNNEDCIEIVKILDLESPYQIFKTDLSKICDYLEVDKEDIGELEKEIQKFSILNLSTYVYLGSFMNLGESVYKVLLGYSEISVFYKDLLSGGIPFLQELLLKGVEGIDKSAICVEAVLMYRSFIENREELVNNINCVKIVKPIKELLVYFASDCVDFNSNLAFLHDVNAKLKFKIYLYPVENFSEKIDFIYWSNMKLNKKNTFILEILKEYPDKIVVNSDNFYEVLLEEIQ